MKILIIHKFGSDIIPDGLLTQYNGIEFLHLYDNKFNEKDGENIDLAFFHFGGVNSVDLSEDDLNKISLALKIHTDKIVFFSKNSSHAMSWDYLINKLINKTIDVNELTIDNFNKVNKEFRNNIYRIRYKNNIRYTLPFFLSSKYKIDIGKNISNQYDYVKTENYKILCNAIRKGTINKIKFKVGSISDFKNYLNILENTIRKFKEKYKINAVFITDTLFFKPSKEFWENVQITSQKYIFLIPPFRDKKDYEKWGYDENKHSNCFLWHPINDNIETIKKFCNKSTTDNININFNLERIKKWLPEEKYNKEISYSKFKNLELFNKAFTKLLSTLQTTEDSLVFYLLLDIISSEFDQHTHKYNANSDPFKDTEKFLSDSKCYYFTQLCKDIKTSIDIIGKNKDIDIGKILIFDDNIIDFTINKVKLPELLSAFFKKNFKDDDIQIINPIEDENKIYTYLSNYKTIFFKSNFHDAITKVERFNPDIILVDLLYNQISNSGDKQPNEIENFSNCANGLNIIKGLNRHLRDNKTGNQSGKLAPIIALSHDDNSSLILDAIKAGAKDYIVKSRIFTLPGIIAKAKNTAGEFTNTYHRNFRSLYNLKNDVIGLLQSKKIPQVESKEYIKTNDPNTKIFTNILDVIPKTDLHVHVGSCMTTEFLVFASFVGLLRFEKSSIESIKFISSIFDSVIEEKQQQLSFRFNNKEHSVNFKGGSEWIKNLGKEFKTLLIDLIENSNHNEKDNESDKQNKQEFLSLFKSYLYKNLNIPDYLDNSKLKAKINSISNFELSFFAIYQHCDCQKIKLFDKFDLIRIYLLALTKKYDKAELTFNDENVLDIFRNSENQITENWDLLNGFFYSGDFSVSKIRNHGWSLPNNKLKIKLNISKPVDFNFEQNPIEYSLATGTRSSSLIEYLEGCEFSGAEHLQHPFLIHLYARQTLFKFIEHGTCYAELRGAPDGYVNRDLGFEYSDVTNCLIQAFNDAQSEVYKCFSGEKQNYQIWKILDKTKINQFNIENDWENKRMPCKVGLIFTGKRHKPIREMILEAAATATLKKSLINNVKNAGDFVENRFKKCDIVGFDLAGKEEGNPPEKFVEEFSRLSKLHIPLTIHAGENASSEFIESAILRLGALRIGHGLSLSEDKALMGRVREEKVCIELCPTGNHQTSHFVQSDNDQGRKYPLKQYLEEGILVSINTDNPIISNTNIVQEFFQASYAINGLSLWEALRIIRMGFVSSFMTLPERKYMLELVDQYLYDIFSDENVIKVLYELE